MSSKRNIVITCWNCHKKFPISASSAKLSLKVYRGLPSSTKPGESRNKKMRLLKTCPHCGKENEIYL